MGFLKCNPEYRAAYKTLVAPPCGDEGELQVIAELVKVLGG